MVTGEPPISADVGRPLHERQCQKAIDLVGGNLHAHAAVIGGAEKGEDLATDLEDSFAPRVVFHRTRLRRALVPKARK